MRLLITGGMGFIGAATIRHILQVRDWHILNVDKLTYAADPARLGGAAADPHYGFVRADIADGAAMSDVFADFQPDAVLHMAAQSHVDRSIRDAEQFIHTNIIGSHVLLEAARRHYETLAAGRRPTFRFHLVSTDEVYGTLGPNGVFNEQSAYAPNSPYSASKAAADMLARAWQRTYGLPVVISNSANNYGPWQHPEKFIPTVLLAAMRGKPIPIFGDGSNIRDWLHVDDHAAALLAVLERGRVGERYCIGGGAERSNIALARALCRLLDEQIPAGTPHEQAIAFVTDRPGHDWRYALDSRKIRGELGWEPRISLEDGLRGTVRWHVENRTWLEQTAASQI